MDPPMLGETLRALTPLTGLLGMVEAVDAEPGWIERDALLKPDEQPLAEVLARVAAPELGEAQSRKAASAWLMLRFGWSCGPQIAGWLALGRVIRVDDYALKLPPGRQLDAVCVKAGAVDAASAAGCARRPRRGLPGAERVLPQPPPNRGQVLHELAAAGRGRALGALPWLGGGTPAAPRRRPGVRCSVPGRSRRRLTLKYFL